MSVLLVTGPTGCANKQTPDVNEPVAETPNVPDGSGETAEAIRALVPAAAGIQNAAMYSVAASATAPTPTSFESKTLTTMLFTYEIDPTDLHEAQAEEFRFLSPKPKPAVLAAESGRTQQLGYFSMIQPDRITDFTCKVDGDRAKGVVSFGVPELYMGKVHYIAERAADRWEIKEFDLPAHGWRFVRIEEGTWEWVRLSR